MNAEECYPRCYARMAGVCVRNALHPLRVDETLSMIPFVFLREWGRRPEGWTPEDWMSLRMFNKVMEVRRRDRRRWSIRAVFLNRNLDAVPARRDGGVPPGMSPDAETLAEVLLEECGNLKTALDAARVRLYGLMGRGRFVAALEELTANLEG